MRLVILGPPGACKGTQATRLADHFGIPAISTGDIFRSNIAEATELGVKVKAIVDSGGYVPDEITNEMVRDRLTQDDAKGGFLLDGYPRTRAQVDELDQMLADDGAALDAVAELTVDADEIVTRLVRRAETSGRSDDAEETVRHRQSVYQEQTAPLTAVYGERGLLVQVDGMGEVDSVTERLLGVLASRA